MGSIGNIFKKIRFSFSKKKGKRFLGILILLGLGTALFSHNTVYAEGTEDQTIEKTQNDMLADVNELFENGLKLIYALLWPVLFIAGIALDNTLVYGSFLHLDASLWSLRNIMKNFANFALGFMVLFAIVKNIFTAPFGGGGDNEKRSPINIIKKTLIAGVLIQMSWFLMAATIDISTILTYSIGGLPMTVMENNPDTKGRPILGVNATLDMNGSSKNLNYYNTYGDKNISLCRVEEVSGLTGKYIIARNKVKVNDDVFFEKGLCTLGAWPYKYKEIEGEKFSNATENDLYKEYLTTYLKNFGSSADARTITEELKADCHIIAINPSNSHSNCTSEKGFGSLNNNSEFFTSTEGMTIDSLLEKSKGFVGPFITIYSSLLDYSSIADSPDGNNSVLSNFFIFLIKFLFAAALFFPLLALAIVLITRVGILWLSIVMLPIIILLKVFDGLIGLGDRGGKGLFTYFDIPNLIKLIFAPVFVVFAISMSMIFLTALDNNDHKNSQNEDIGQAQLEELGIITSEDGKTYSILGLVDITLDGSAVDDGLDTFAWLITNLFVVGIIWFFLFFAVKMTKIGESVGGGLQTTVQNLVKNLPMIPIAGGVGISAISDGVKGLGNKLTQPMHDKQIKELQKSMPWLYGTPVTDSNVTLSDFNAEQQADIKSNQGVRNLLSPDTQKAMENKGVGGVAGGSGVYNTYVSNHLSEFNYETILGNRGVGIDNKEGITTYDAENLTTGNIENLSHSDDKWIEWAKGVVGGNVKTADGIKVMVNQGTHSSPDFKLVSQETYASEYLGIEDGGGVTKEDAEKLMRVKIEAQYKDKKEDVEDGGIKKLIDAQVAKHMKEYDDRKKAIDPKLEGN